ncbi:hypothetical protein [Nocardia stercoris]|uniref:MarR family transcriptional regulator n=1 Tax=Nocardia stercoris TaxID=2483361 RepID=A0A3M2KYG1_9NOCA|nr:hypothetical protein [Nocardia stercoris]RMI30104.1 hypothetical protein EBN03_23030 [Nocardia stercoris]
MDVLRMLLLGRRLVELSWQAIEESDDRETDTVARQIVERAVLAPGSSLPDLAQAVGITVEEVTAFLDRMTASGILEMTAVEGGGVGVWPTTETMADVERRAGRPVREELIGTLSDVAAAERATALLTELADLLLDD